MSTLDLVNEALSSQWLTPKWVGDEVCVPTVCLYPSGSWVAVYVSAGTNEVAIHDDANAIWEARSAGIRPKNLARTLHHIASKYDLDVMGNGAFVAAGIPMRELAPCITLVSNASQEAATFLFKKYKVTGARNIREQLTKFLEREFPDRVKHESKIAGKSNKEHKFDHLVSLPHDRRIVVDFASNDASSINAKIVSNYDVRLAERPYLMQRIVYDEEEDWNASDISLLEVGAPVVPYGKLPDALKQLSG